MPTFKSCCADIVSLKVPLAMSKRVASATPGKHALDKSHLLDRFKKPRIRKTVRLGKLSKFMKMPFDVILEVSCVDLSSNETAYEG